ncbi:MAG: PorV/PorQ family protein [Candidatus Kryptoniota bacterium]
MKIINVLMVTAFSAGLAFAQTRVGTSAAPELEIPVGAQYVGMSGSPLAFVQGVEAITWNPAGVDWGGKTGGALFSYRSYIADMGISYVAVVGRFGFGSLGLSFRSFNIGTINVTTEFSPDGTGERITPTFFVGGLTYSKLLSDRVSVGLNVNVISESIGRVSTSGLSFDAGVQYKDLIGIKGLATGIAVRNIGPSMTYGGSGLWVSANDPASERGTTFYKIQAAAFQLPSVFEIGLGYSYPIDSQDELILSGTYQNNNFGIDEYRVGVQYGFRNSLYIRGGYNYSKDPSGVVSIWENYTLGAGVALQSLTGLDLSFDYAFVPVQHFNPNHLFDLKIGF